MNLETADEGGSDQAPVRGNGGLVGAAGVAGALTTGVVAGGTGCRPGVGGVVAGVTGVRTGAGSGGSPRDCADGGVLVLVSVGGDVDESTCTACGLATTGAAGAVLWSARW